MGQQCGIQLKVRDNQVIGFEPWEDFPFIFSGISLVVMLLVVLQLWLLTATMNAWLGGDSSIVWPAALASLGCFLVNFWLLRRVFYLQGVEE